MAHEDRLSLRCTGERSQTAPKGSVQSDSDREGDRRFQPHNRRKSKMPAIVHPSSTVCSTRALRVINLDLVIELWKSLGHAPRHEAENLRVPVQPGRPNHCSPRTIWLCYNGILGDVDPFALDLNAIVTVM